MQVASCKCEECHYNKNFKCNADSIDVMSSPANNKVSCADDTRCNTFKSKG